MDPQLAGFQALWDAARVLCPRRIVALGPIGISDAGRLEAQGLSVALQGAADAESAIAFPGYRAAAPPHLRVDCGRWVLLFLSARGLDSDQAGELQWLRDNAAKGAGTAGVILFLDRPIWDSSPAAWAQVRGVLEAAAGGYVLAGGSERFSWWREGSVQCQAIRPAVAPGAAPRSVADGEFAGLVWITMGRETAGLYVIDPLTVQAPEVFARRFQDERRALRESLQASPVLAGEGVTEVRCSNPTEEPLTFDAEWRFDGNAGRVEPQMLGFSLGPGQAFRQRFHLQADGALPLKFASPRLFLRTTCRDGLGQSVPVRLDVAPRVRMGGPLGQLGDTFAVDGDLRDWPFGGLPVNHASQVVLQREAWRGATDYSGAVYMGEQGGRLCAAVTLRRQPGDQVSCLLLVDPRGAGGDDYSAEAGPVTVSVSPRGQVDIQGVPADIVSAAWKPAADGGVLEVALAGRAFADGQLPQSILAEVVLTRYGPSGDAVTSLCFSGDDQGLRSSRLYARFQRPQPGSGNPVPDPPSGAAK